MDVISGGDIRYQLTKSGMPDDTTIDVPSIKALGRMMRADEFLLGQVERGGGAVRITGSLVLMRDNRMTEPLPAASAGDLGTAAEEFAHSLAAARGELIPQRRCENALRDGQPRF